jgi:hypothetical protein
LKTAGTNVNLLALHGAGHDFSGHHAELAHCATFAFLDLYLKGKQN